MEKINTFLITIVLFIASFLGFQLNKTSQQLSVFQNKLTELEINITESNEYIQNETAIVHRIIGDSIPVIVPERYEEALTELSNQVETFTEGSGFEKLIKTYEDFITNTPPWIQDEKLRDLIFLKQKLDYQAILVNYDKEKDLLHVIQDLELYISLNSDFIEIDDVLNTYKEKINEYNKIIENKIEALINSSEMLLTDSNATLEDVQNMIVQLESFSGETEIDDKLEEMANYYTIVETRNYAKEQDIMYEKYKRSTNLTSDFDYVTSQNLINGAIYLQSYDYEKYKKQEKMITEIQTTAGIERTLIDIKSTLNSVADEDLQYSMALLTQVKSQLSIITNNLAILELVDTAALKKQANILKTTYESIQEKAGKYHELKIQEYNKRALEVLQEVNLSILENKEGIFGTISHEQKAVLFQNHIIKISEIDEQYLYRPISTLYSEVFSKLWAGFEESERYSVSLALLNVEKRGLID